MAAPRFDDRTTPETPPEAQSRLRAVPASRRDVLPTPRTAVGQSKVRPGGVLLPAPKRQGSERKSSPADLPRPARKAPSTTGRPESGIVRKARRAAPKVQLPRPPALPKLAPPRALAARAVLTDDTALSKPQPPMHRISAPPPPPVSKASVTPPIPTPPAARPSRPPARSSMPPAPPPKQSIQAPALQKHSFKALGAAPLQTEALDISELEEVVASRPDAGYFQNGFGSEPAVETPVAPVRLEPQTCSAVEGHMRLGAVGAVCTQTSIGSSKSGRLRRRNVGLDATLPAFAAKAGANLRIGFDRASQRFPFLRGRWARKATDLANVLGPKVADMLSTTIARVRTSALWGKLRAAFPTKRLPSYHELD